MAYDFSSRASSHPWIDSVWSYAFLDNGIYRATPDGCWLLFQLLTPGCEPRVVLSASVQCALTCHIWQGNES